MVASHEHNHGTRANLALGRHLGRRINHVCKRLNLVLWGHSEKPRHIFNRLLPRRMDVERLAVPFGREILDYIEF